VKRLLPFLFAGYWLCSPSVFDSKGQCFCSEVTQYNFLEKLYPDAIFTGEYKWMNETNESKTNTFKDAPWAASRETDYELREKEKALGIYRPLTGDECMMILRPRIDRLQEKLDGFMKVKK
jgi:hypothetical protein